MLKKTPKRKPFRICDQDIAPGNRKTIDVPVSVLSDHTPVTMSVHIVHGRMDGPTMFVSAAVHGDEVNGVEIVRRLLQSSCLNKMKGTLLAIPIVNAFGFMNHSRYLPDRRDLNRSFPGSPTGSLASRLAHIFIKEIVQRSEVGIDLHSAAVNRTNLPQIRVSPSKPNTMDLAHAFAAPITLTSKVREGSLRESAQNNGVDVLLYEAGEGLRFDEFSVRAGVSGILRVMRHLGMVSAKGVAKSKYKTILSKGSTWTRAPAGGLLRTYKTTGDKVEIGDILGVVSDPFGEVETEVTTDRAGLLIGRTNLPIVNEGDGLFHIANINTSFDPVARISNLEKQLEEDRMLDEDEII